MLRLVLKKIIPFRLRRTTRNLQAYLRKKLHNCIYQIWILKYDQHPKITQNLHPDFVAFIDKNCLLAPDAFYQINQFLNLFPDSDLLYTDSDQIHRCGFRFNPYFKTDWDPYLFLEQDYFKPFFVVRKALLDQNNMLPADINQYCIRHLPQVLCHSRKPFKIQKSLNPTTFYLPSVPPLISIIIPTHDGLSLLKPCIESIFAKNKNQNFEILIVNNNSKKFETLEYFSRVKSEKIRILDYPHPFNYSAINNFAAKAAKGEILLLLNNDIEMLSENNLDVMLSLALQKDVGIVGTKLYYPNKTIQHAGIVLGIDGTSRHILTGLKQTASGYFGNLHNVHCCSAVTAACLMIPKSTYEKVGGLDETLFPVTFNDIDLCLKVRERGYHIVFTPYAEFYHKESATRGEDLSQNQRKRANNEMVCFINKWKPILYHDPFYNPNLSLKSTNYALAFPPRTTHAMPNLQKKSSAMLKSKLPLVSIAIPTYNRLPFLQEALASAQAQTYSNLEIIVFDNASTDGTSNWLKKQEKLDPRLKVIINPYNMTSKSILQTPLYIRGQYLLILCDDDLIASTFIERAVQKLEENPNICLWFSRTEVFSTDKTGTRHILRYTPSKYAGIINGKQLVKLTFARKLPIYWCSTVYRVSTLEKVKGFDTELRFLDMANNLNCALQGQAFSNHEVLAYYRETHLNDTKTMDGRPIELLKHYEKMYRKICQHAGHDFDSAYLRFAICCSLGHILTWSALPYYWQAWQFLKLQGYSKVLLLYLLTLNVPRTLFRLTFGPTAKQRLSVFFKNILHKRRSDD